MNEIDISIDITKMIRPIINPGIQPNNDTCGTSFINVYKAGDISAKFKYGKTELLQFLKK